MKPVRKVVRRRRLGACHEWQGAHNGVGYPVRTRNKKFEYVHREVWAEANGPIPDGMIVMHICDNPPCIRLDHLVLGTYQDNTRDMFAKGRGVDNNGERNGRAKLSRADVTAIRRKVASGMKQVEVAREYGVVPSRVSEIISSKSWR